MKISVVIPAYNEEKNIHIALTAVNNQSRKPDEIIVVDNNCTDKTVEIAKNMGNVIVVKETTQGMIPARNRGFESSSGDVIARTDADTFVPPGWLARIEQDMQDLDIGAVSGPVRSPDFPLIQAWTTNLLYASYKPFIHGMEFMVGPNMAIRKSVWEAISNSVCLQDSLVHEDMDLGFTVQEHGFKVFYDKKLIVDISGRRMRKNPASFFIEYPQRAFATFRYHRDKLNKNKSS